MRSAVRSHNASHLHKLSACRRVKKDIWHGFNQRVVALTTLYQLHTLYAVKCDNDFALYYRQNMITSSIGVPHNFAWRLGKTMQIGRYIWPWPTIKPDSSWT